MEWLFQKMIEGVGESYSPELVKQILVQHRETIVNILWGGSFFVFICAIYVIFTEIRFSKFSKKLKDLEKKQDSL